MIWFYRWMVLMFVCWHAMLCYSDAAWCLLREWVVLMPLYVYIIVILHVQFFIF